MQALAMAFSPRFIILTVAVLLTLLCLALIGVGAMHYARIFLTTGALLFGALTLLGVRDLIQTRHAVLRNYPISAHLRFLLEGIRPEIRQYFFESESDGMPFSRTQRAIVYQRAKMALDKRPFGTAARRLRARLRMARPFDRAEARRRPGFPRSRSAARIARQPYSLSVFNISAMSFGALSANAIRALNTGRQARRLRARHRRGRLQPLSSRGRRRHHLGDRLAAISAAATPDGRFRPKRFAAAAANRPGQDDRDQALARAPSPAMAACCPAAKVTRGDRRDARRADGRRLHLARRPQRLLDADRDDAVHRRAARARRAASRSASSSASATPGNSWRSARRWWRPGSRPISSSSTARRAAPARRRSNSPIISACRCARGCVFVHNALVGAGLRDRIRIGAAGKIVTRLRHRRVMALGADWCNAARGFMFALGCIQSLSCHTDRCPTGVATQDLARRRRSSCRTRPSGCAASTARWCERWPS